MTLESLAREMREARARYDELMQQCDRAYEHIEILVEKKRLAQSACMAAQDALVKRAMETP